MKKEVRVRLSDDAEVVYKYLNKEKAKADKTGKKSKEAQIFDAFNKKKELIKNNIHYGEPIAKPKIPLAYKQKYGVDNLFWVSLPCDWRFFYSLTNVDIEIEITAFVVEITDHKAYSKKFGYRK